MTIDNVLRTTAIDFCCCRQADIMTYRAAIAAKKHQNIIYLLFECNKKYGQ